MAPHPERPRAVTTVVSRKEKVKRKKEKRAEPAENPALNSPSPGPDPKPETVREQRHRESREYRQRRLAEANARATELPQSRPNPLLKLDEERSARLFVWMRECPFHDAVKQMLAEQGIPGVTSAELEQFFESEANRHWLHRLQCAATEANALVNLVEQNQMKFSSGILAALGQEAFRQVVSGNVAPESLTRMVNLFIKARSDERADQMMDLRRENFRRDWQDQTEKALEEFAREIEKHPAAREAFEALREELRKAAEGDA